MSNFSTSVKKNKKALLIIGGVLLLIIIIYIVYRLNKPPVKNLDGNTNPNATPTDVVSPDKILHKGDRGNTVKALQNAINDKITLYNIASSVPHLTVDGSYGSKTDSAIQKLTYQTYGSSMNNVTVNSIKSGDFSTPPNITGGLPTPTSGGAAVYSQGDNIYANKLTNAYSSLPPTSSNLVATFHSGDLVGTYLTDQSPYSKINMPSQAWYSNGYEEVYLVTNDIYK